MRFINYWRNIAHATSFLLTTIKCLFKWLAIQSLFLCSSVKKFLSFLIDRSTPLQEVAQ